MDGLFLVDTNILLGYIREAEYAQRAHIKFDLGNPNNTVSTSVVCHGELLALAEKRGWGAATRSRLEHVLSQILTQSIMDRSILNAYAKIDAWTRGKSVNAPNNAPPLKPAMPMSQNDIWIAATAHVTQSTLLSTDRDFVRLDGVWIKFHLVDQHLRTGRLGLDDALPGGG